MKKVLAFGTFDGLHPGHLFFLREAKSKGDFLVIVVARDKNVKKIKGELPHNNQYERVDMIQNTGIADEVRLGNEEMKYLQIINEINPDIICLGYDQQIPKNFEEIIKKLEKKIEVVTLQSFKPELFKTTKLKKLLGFKSKKDEKVKDK